MRLYRFLGWLCRQKVEHINSGGDVPYLVRFVLLRSKWINVYVHHFVGDDWARDPHDHPKRFVTIGLWGSYNEFVYPPGTDSNYKLVHHRSPWIRTFPAEHTHRIEAAEHGNVWTLVFSGPWYREWGFVQNGKWIKWNEYVDKGAA